MNRARWWRILLGVVIALAMIEGLAVWRAAGHLNRARAHRRDGQIVEAAREYQSAIGYAAPLNPFSRQARIEMREFVEGPERGEIAGFQLRDRYQRSLRSTRSIWQPLANGVNGDEITDPHPWLFLGSIIGLAMAFIALLAHTWMSPKRLLVGISGLLLWVVLLTLC